jgi:hypothetical protein
MSTAVAVLCKSRNCFDRSDTGIVGSNPSQNMGVISVCVCGMSIR